MKNFKRYAIGLFILAVFSPLGLLASGTAWGEWGNDELIKKLGFIPAGFEKLSATWQHVLIPDYAVPGLEGSFLRQSIGYILAAVIGILLVGGICFLIGRIVLKPQSNTNMKRSCPDE